MLNVALVGFGYWGPNIARNINNNPNLNLSAVLERKEQHLIKKKEIKKLQKGSLKFKIFILDKIE